MVQKASSEAVMGLLGCSLLEIGMLRFLLVKSLIKRSIGKSIDKAGVQSRDQDDFLFALKPQNFIVGAISSGNVDRLICGIGDSSIEVAGD